MPTYQYVCTECGTPLEVVQSFTDAALVECPTCGGRLRKVFSAVGVVFKGSGFYRNDSRSEKKTPVSASAKSGGEGKSGSDSKSGGDKGSSSESKSSSSKESSGSSTTKDSSGSGSTAGTKTGSGPSGSGSSTGKNSATKG